MKYAYYYCQYEESGRKVYINTVSGKRKYRLSENEIEVESCIDLEED